MLFVRSKPMGSSPAATSQRALTSPAAPAPITATRLVTVRVSTDDDLRQRRSAHAPPDGRADLAGTDRHRVECQLPPHAPRPRRPGVLRAHPGARRAAPP